MRSLRALVGRIAPSLVAFTLLPIGAAFAEPAGPLLRIADPETASTPGSPAPSALPDATRPAHDAAPLVAPTLVSRTLVPGDSTGSAVAAAGDVNGDGFSDYLVGSPSAGGGTGRVEVYLGSASGTVSLQRTLTSGDAGSRFGASVAGAGDVNGDGYDDIVVGQPDRSPGGQVWVFLGGPGGVAASPDTVFQGTSVLGRLGACVAGAGDLNGDSYGDVVAGAPASDAGVYFKAGVASVWYGGPSGLHGPPSLLAGADFHQARGTSVAGAGDLDADGYDDLVVGAPYDVPGFGQGRVYLYRGSASGVSVAADSLAGGLAGEAFGWAVAPAGDYDGDGYADVVVGSPLAANGGTPEVGKAFLVRGAATGFAPPGAALLTGTQLMGHLGWAVGCAGDYNGDGLGDVLVGEPLYDGGVGMDEGRVHLAYGNRGTGGLPVQVIPSPGAGAQAGAAVSGVGDLSTDGFGDLAVGAPGTASGSGSVMVLKGQVATAARFAGFSFSSASGAAAQMGYSVAAGGDINGDGLDDALMGSPGDRVTIANEGVVFPLWGSVDGFVVTGASNPHGGQAGSRFGAAVAVAGDVNGDGYDDAIVGAPAYTSGAAGEGAAFLFLGSATGLDTLPAQTWLGGTAGLHWGSAVSSAGDLDGDGYLDLAVGSFEDATNGTRAGRVAFYLGGPSAPSTAPAFQLFGAVAGESLGVAIAAAGDVNGDGYDDVVVGAPGYSSGLGRVVVVFGAPSPPYATAMLASGLAPGSGFGHSLAGRGDVDGDGFADLAVGAPWATSGAGAVEVHRGGPGGLDAAAATTLAGNSALGATVAFGTSVSFGDLSGDGLSDLVVGAPGENGNQAGQGALEAYLSTGAGAFSAPTRLTKIQAIYMARGFAVAANSDFNGDGFADVVDGAPGSNGGWGATEFAGGGGVIRSLDRIERMKRDDFSTPVALEGHSETGTSVRLALRARTPAGRQTLKVEYQAGTIAQPFSTLPVQFSIIAKPGAPTTGGVYMDMFQGLVGLPPGANMRWHMRVRTRLPWFPATPWLTPSGNAATLADVRMPVAPSAVGPIRGSRTLALAEVRPNPGSGTVTLSFTLPAPGRIRLAVYDAAGRLVRELADGPRAAGAARTSWDGRDGSGRSVPSGVYFARLEGAGQAVTRRFARLR